MLYVRNDEAAYVWWLEANDSGFVANLGTGGKNRAMLHRTRCFHLYPPDPGKVHTVQPEKACSRDRDDLERWVRDNRFEMVPCPDCKP